MASPTAMAKCLRADARLMAVDDDEIVARAEALAQNLVATTDDVVATVGLGRPFTTVILMLGTAIALEGDGDEGR